MEIQDIKPPFYKFRKLKHINEIFSVIEFCMLEDLDITEIKEDGLKYMWRFCGVFVINTAAFNSLLCEGYKITRDIIIEDITEDIIKE